MKQTNATQIEIYDGKTYNYKMYESFAQAKRECLKLNNAFAILKADDSSYRCAFAHIVYN